MVRGPRPPGGPPEKTFPRIRRPGLCPMPVCAGMCRGASPAAGPAGTRGDIFFFLGRPPQTPNYTPSPIQDPNYTRTIGNCAPLRPELYPNLQGVAFRAHGLPAPRFGYSSGGGLGSGYSSGSRGGVRSGPKKIFPPVCPQARPPGSDPDTYPHILAWNAVRAAKCGGKSF